LADLLKSDTPEPGTPRLDVELRHRIGTLTIDVKFSLLQPWTVLFGPSGSGKSTILRAIAGLVRPDSGRIVCTTASKTLMLLDTVKDIFVPAHQRAIPLAAQQPNLFPHLSVIENILYGTPMILTGDSLSDFTQTGKESLIDFGLTHVSGRLAQNISGGEAQRVNLARALASHSRLLLFDEPFTGMDVDRRDQLLPLLQDKLAGRCVPVLSVTHDVAEAFQLNAEVIKIADGKVVAQGPVEVVLAEERKRLLEQLNGAAGSPA
jgi:molybdate transport system ATP-binding protein